MNCPHCGGIILTASRRHPDTSHAAARVANLTANERAQAVFNVMIAIANWGSADTGATDDEIDAVTNWGHASTSGLMSTLRRAKLVVWLKRDGKYVKRKTRKGCWARVNVLAKYGGGND